MFQRLGVEFNSSLFQIPLMTNTRDSLDPKYIAGGSKELGKVLTSGADHLQLLLNVNFLLNSFLFPPLKCLTFRYVLINIIKIFLPQSKKNLESG